MKYLEGFKVFEKKSYNKPRKGGKKRWSLKYKKSIKIFL